MSAAQVSRRGSIGPDMETATSMAVIAQRSVRCLACGIVYAQPLEGGTAATNPGCPGCGYLGWADTDDPLSRGYERRRSGVDLRLLRSARRD